MNIRHLLVLFASSAISVLTMSAHSGDDSVQAAKDRETYGSPELMQNVYGRDYELLPLPRTLVNSTTAFSGSQVSRTAVPRSFSSR